MKAIAICPDLEYLGSHEDCLSIYTGIKEKETMITSYR